MNWAVISLYELWVILNGQKGVGTINDPPSAQAASRSYALLGLSNLNIQILASSEQLLAFFKIFTWRSTPIFP